MFIISHYIKNMYLSLFKKMYRKFLSLLLSFLLVLQGFVWYSPAAAQEKTSHTLAVLDLIANGVSESETRSLSSSLRGQVTREIMSERYRNLSKVDYTVVDRSQMDKIFDEFKIQSTGCTDISCAIEFGKILSVEKIIIGEVGLVGGTYTFNASIVDVETAKVTAAAEYKYTGAIDNLLNRGIPHIVDTLLYRKTVSKKKWYYVIGGAILIAGVTAGILSRDGGGGGEKTGTLIIDVPDKPDEP